VQPFSLFAPAKINLALHVLGRRVDGYHDLDSIVAFADAGDRLTFALAERFTITAEGPFASALPPQDGNIIAKAWVAASEIAAKRGQQLPQVAVRLEKNLPVASGIGGGSSNAAAAIKGFLRFVGIDPADPDVAAAGLGIGADVPVCLLGKACRMRGIGENLTPLSGFHPLQAILVNPLVSVPTPEVFRGLGLERGQAFRRAIDNENDPLCWRNDLAAPAIALAPVIGEVLQKLAATPGVIRAFMSGSGATCVALCEGSDAAPDLDPNWWVARTILA
jgi:4-diphosphocytidyl-2-C-methyl-D-erythritol kinase